MITLYGVPSCNKIRDTRSLLDKKNISYTFVDVKKRPLTREKLSEIAQKLGLEKVVNKRGTTYRKLGLSGRDIQDEELFDLLLQNQSMITRPLLEKNNRYHIGFDEQAILKFSQSS